MWFRQLILVCAVQLRTGDRSNQGRQPFAFARRCFLFEQCDLSVSLRRKRKHPQGVCFLNLLSTQILSTLQAFSEVLSQAAAGNTSNTTVSPSDIRARVTLSYLSGNVDFVGLISAFYAALNDGDWSGLEWTEYAAAYVVQVLPVMPTYCSNQRKCFHISPLNALMNL